MWGAQAEQGLRFVAAKARLALSRKMTPALFIKTTFT